MSWTCENKSTLTATYDVTSNQTNQDNHQDNKRSGYGFSRDCSSAQVRSRLAVELWVGAEEEISTDRKVTTSKNQEDFLTCWETILLIVPFNNNMAHKPRVTFGSQMSRISDKFYTQMWILGCHVSCGRGMTCGKTLNSDRRCVVVS